MSTTKALTKQIQRHVEVQDDGIWGPNTARAVIAKLDIPEPEAPKVSRPEFSKWHQFTFGPTPSQKRAHYGTPRKGYPHLVTIDVAYPLRLSWEKSKTVSRISVHKKSAPKFKALFERWLDHFGLDGIDHYGLDLYGGAYNHRSIRGGKSWSDHAYGAALDIDPDRNGLRTSWENSFMPIEAVHIAETCGLTNIVSAMGRDAMHFSDINYGRIDDYLARNPGKRR